MAAHRKSIEQLKKSGTYRADRHANRGEISTKALKELPAPPVALEPGALEFWEVAGAAMVAQKTLKETDLFMLAAYARESAIYQFCSEKAVREGIVETLHNGVTCVSHYRRAGEQALKNILALSDRLGLNPKSRWSLKGIADGEEDKTKDDPFLRLLLQNGKIRPN